ncbi:MAG: radical SAM protein [Candidatus Aminicenantes bacterium]|nr:radical SAM protein [Candidatus Aminicenantes bacterium]
MAKADFSIKRIHNPMPRLPLEGNIDLTYRCNNNCRHCWVNVKNSREEQRKELGTWEWLDIIDQARALGARDWAISGGEPLLREDFTEVFAHVRKKASSCSLNTNGTLITPAISHLLKKDCVVMVSIYGATEKVHDHVTRNPGSFTAVLRGIAYLLEAGVRPLIQLVPLMDNFSQWHEMIALVQGLGLDWRMGAASLILSASGDEGRNEEIRAQRLAPAQIIELNPPNVAYEERHTQAAACKTRVEQRRYGDCISERNIFHVDPTGSLSFCCFIKEEQLRYDLKKGSFAEGWDKFLPALASKAQDCLVFDQECRICELQPDCQRCPAMSYLEHRRAEAPSGYLCQLLKEGEKYRQNWKTCHQRYFRIAGITIEMNCEREFMENSFSPAFLPFAVAQPGNDVLRLECFFSLPEWNEKQLGKLVYDQVPWMIYQKGDSWSYLAFTEHNGVKDIHQLAIFSDGYAHGRIFSNSDYRFQIGNLNSLAMMPTDQIWLAQALLPRQAFFIHSCGLVVDGNGLLFVGHSQAGKSTLAKLFAGQAELLCDDRNIVRRWPQQGWQVHGTWSHGELAQVSAAAAPLRGMFFLEQSAENAVIPIRERMEFRKRLIPCLPRPYVDAKWWETIWPLISSIADDVPAYVIRFNKNGKIVPLIRELNSGFGAKQAGFLQRDHPRD